MTNATLHTNRGDIEVELYDERAPNTVENFVGLATGEQEWEDGGETVEEPLYDDIAFHRVIEGFMIQGGDPDESGRGGPGYSFDDEFHDELRHDSAGILSMANSGPNTNGSQFFITLDAQPHLDDRHAVFGKVTDGMDVVREIGTRRHRRERPASRRGRPRIRRSPRLSSTPTAEPTDENSRSSHPFYARRTRRPQRHRRA